MNRALLLLLAYSVRGRVVRSARLLREPRYLVGSLVFALWLGTWIGPAALGALSRGSGVASGLPEDTLRLLQLGIAVLLAGGVTVTWLLPPSRMSLGLSSAEIELLSSAPVRRRELIQHAIVKNQAGILFGAAIMTLVMGTGGLGARLLWLASFWLLLTNGDLNGKARSLFKARLRELPPARARLLAGAALSAGAALWAIVLVSIAHPVERLFTGLPDALERGAAGELVSAVSVDLAHGAHRVVLAPLLWLLEPGLATLGDAGGSTAGVALALLFGLALALVQNEWVVRSQFKFEESALEHARREGLKKDPGSRYRKVSRTHRMRAPFELSPRGAAGAGLLWKSMLQVRRGSLLRNAAAGVLLALALGLVPPLVGAPSWIPRSFIGVGFMFLAFSGFFMPLYPRNDLRTDLLRLEVIRPWPVPDWQVFAWEVAGPTIEGVLGAAFAACLIVSSHVGLRLSGTSPGELLPLEGLGFTGPLGLPLLVLGLLPVAAGLSFLTSVLTNLLVVYMPGWVPLGPHKARGAAAFGHNILLSSGLFLASGIVLALAALAVAGIALVQTGLLGLPLGTWQLPMLGVVAALPAVGAGALGVRLGALLWARLDASREILDSSS